MAKHHLTPKFVEHLSPSGTYRFTPDASGRIEIGDLKVQGLIFRITRTGLKTWSFIYRPRTRKNGKWVAGPQQRITLGRYPSISLKEAREVAMDYYEQVIAGEDPRQELREQERQTFELVMTQFYEKSLVSRSKHPHLWMQRMRKHIPEEWLSRPIQDITRGDVHDLLDKVLETLGDDLTDALDQAAGATGEEAERYRQSALKQINDYRRYVKTDPLVKGLDKNPFTKVTVQKSAETVLKTLEAALKK